MTDVCHNRPLDDRGGELSRLRDAFARELATRPSARVEPVRPVAAYTIAFAEVPHRSIRSRVAALYSWRSRLHRREPERGHVYVFRDRRDRPRSLVKIGSTVHVRRRMAQWRAELGATDTPDDVRLLFSFETRHVRMAEALVHALLFCQWQAKRVNVASNRRAVEYFDVADWRALRRFVAATTRHVDWWLASAKSPTPQAT